MYQLLKLFNNFWFLLLVLAISRSFVKGLEQDGSLVDCKPEHVHLSYGKTTTDVVVLWETQKPCTSRVQYADHEWNLNLEAEGTTEDLTNCGGKNCSIKFIHRVVLENLSPGSTIFYRPISGESRVGPFYFKVPMQAESDPLEFLITSESGLSSQSGMMRWLVDAVYSQPHAAIFMETSKPQQLACPMVENVLGQMKELVQKLPLMITTDTDPGEDTCYQSVFPMPGSAWPPQHTDTARTTQWYSLDVGMVHFLVYPSRLFLEPSSQGKALTAWMVKDLTAVKKARTQTPWVVAIGSDPMYCQEEGLDCAKNDSLVRHGLEDIFYVFGVDLVLEYLPGVYERTWPHYKGVLLSQSYHQPTAPVEVILPSVHSSAAASPQDAGNGNETVKTTADAWSALRLNPESECYGHLSVANISHLHFEFRALKDGQEVVLDDLWLVQEHHGNFSLALLSHELGHRVNQSIIAMGGKPGTYDFISTLTPGPSQKGEGWSKYSLWFGLGLVGVAIFVVLGVVTIRSYLRRRRNNNGGRRWREVDCQGSSGGGTGHFYSMASDSDSDGENDRDFEIDMFARASKSESKLLTSY